MFAASLAGVNPARQLVWPGSTVGADSHRAAILDSLPMVIGSCVSIVPGQASSDLELLRCSPGDCFDIDMFDTGCVGSMSQPLGESVQCSAATVGNHFDPAVAPIDRVPGQSQLFGLLPGRSAKEHALNLARDQKAPGVHASGPDSIRVSTWAPVSGPIQVSTSMPSGSIR